MKFLKDCFDATEDVNDLAARSTRAFSSALRSPPEPMYMCARGSEHKVMLVPHLNARARSLGQQAPKGACAQTLSRRGYYACRRPQGWAATPHSSRSKGLGASCSAGQRRRPSCFACQRSMRGRRAGTRDRFGIRRHAGVRGGVCRESSPRAKPKYAPGISKWGSGERIDGKSTEEQASNAECRGPVA